jgi:hypothetical protein
VALCRRDVSDAAVTMLQVVPVHEARGPSARLRALLRRQASGRDEVAVLGCGSLRIDLLKREVWADTRAIALTTAEFKLLVALARAPGRALARRPPGGGTAPAGRLPAAQVCEPAPPGVGRQRRRRRRAGPQPPSRNAASAAARLSTARWQSCSMAR